MHAVERLAAPSGEQAGHRLVRQDHQLLDEHVRVRLRLVPRVGDAALPVERERGLAALDPERAASEAPVAQIRGHALGSAQRLGQLRLGLFPAGQDRLRLRVGQPRLAPDDRAVEARLAGGELDLDGDAEPIDIRPQRARVVRELVRQHRRDQAGHVDREGALGGPAVERRARLDEPGDVRDVDEDAVVVERQRVVEVLRRLRVDRERELVSKVDAALGRRLAQLERLEPLALAFLDEQAFEHRLDRARLAEDALELRPPAPLAQDGEIAGARLAAAALVQHERHPRA